MPRFSRKMGLGQIACQIQSCIRTGLGNVGKIDVGGQICQPDEVERIVDNVVSVVSDQCALIALRVVILRRIKTVVDEYHTPRSSLEARVRIKAYCCGCSSLV